MNRRYHLPLPLRRLPVWALATGLTACGWFSSAPESRARDYIQESITEPDNTERLAALSHPNVTLDQVMDSLSGRVAADYLRAKHRQGVPLKFNVDRVEKADDERRIKIAVIDQTQARHGAYSKIVFQVHLKNSERGWLVTRVQIVE